MERSDWVPEDLDIERPAAARIYDYLLGGSHNFAVDRDFARQAMTAIPNLALQAQANRAFLHRAVAFLIDAGVRQFLDLGSGIPTRGNVHEVAQRAAADARVVYVEIDPVAVSHSRHILSGNDLATVVEEDLRNTDAIINHADVRRLLDFERPIAVLLVAILHAIPDSDEPHGIVTRLLEAIPSGSYVVIAHGTHDSRPDVAQRLIEMSQRTPTPQTYRTHAEVLRFFDGLALVEPGLVWTSLWRPESPDDVPDNPGDVISYAGVGRKP